MSLVEAIKSNRRNLNQKKHGRQPPLVSSKRAVDDTVNLSDGESVLFSYPIKFYEDSGKTDAVLQNFLPLMGFSIFSGFNLDIKKYQYPNGDSFGDVHNTYVEHWWEEIEGSSSDEWEFKLLIKNNTGSGMSLAVSFHIFAFMPDSYFVSDSPTKEKV